MNDRTKDIILKTLLVICMILLFMVFPGSIFISFLVPEQRIFDVIFNTILFAMLGVGILFMILLPIFGGLKRKPVKAEKKALPFSSYNEILIFLQKRLNEKAYCKTKKISIGTTGELTVYTKATKLWSLDCFTVIRIPELSDTALLNINDSITEILTEYYRGKTITDTINMISLFCVDRITPTFLKIANGNIRQSFKNGRLPIGISFGGKSIYIAKQNDGFAVLRYKRLRKELIDIMQLE